MTSSPSFRKRTAYSRSLRWIAGCVTLLCLGFVRTTAVTVITSDIPLDATCGAPATPIHVVQGTGATSPLVGQVVDVEAVVIASFQGAAQLGGFYLETPAGVEDNDPQTSEGIFVAAGTPAVALGDLVRVRGTVAELTSSTGSHTSNLTSLVSTSYVTVCASDLDVPTLVFPTLPVDHVSDFERYEGDAGGVLPVPRGHRHRKSGHARSGRSRTAPVVATDADDRR
jgi:predicted extracellular nuclease